MWAALVKEEKYKYGLMPMTGTQKLGWTASLTEAVWLWT